MDGGCLKTIKDTLKSVGFELQFLARNPRKVFVDPGAEKAYSRYTTSNAHVSNH